MTPVPDSPDPRPAAPVLAPLHPALAIPGRAPSHPGLVLRETIAAHGLPIARVATHLHLPRQRLHEIIGGHRGITADTALRLETLFGERAETWMARQARHDLDLARHTPESPRASDPST